jgi:tRNA pseudouridine38-40 synthase
MDNKQNNLYPTGNKFRYKITLEYVGAGFCGWQRQAEALSLQQLIEEAIFKFSKESVLVTAAGRTDAGVNAYGQVASFDLATFYEPRRVMHSINHFCRPHKVGVTDCRLVDQDFNARFSAKQRYYVYKIINRQSINIINAGLQYWVREPLDVELMRKAASYLIGKHDFSSFRAAQCQSSSPVKTISNIEITREGENIEIYVSAISFLHHMVRNIVGNLLQVGKGIWPPEKMKEILEQRNRSRGAPTAPAEGLYFLKVDY